MKDKLIKAFIIVMTMSCGILTAAANDSIPLHSPASTPSMPAGEFTYNLPCKVVSIHPEQPGRALLFLWLHGGVNDQPKHSFFTFNHFDCCAADDSIISYLDRHHIKAIALMPICHKATSNQCVHWRDCYDDVKHMINDLVGKGMVDPERIYLAGSSDGGVGTWDYAQHSDVFAAAISMSCSSPRHCEIPVFFYNTADERDCTADVEQLRREGANIVEYKYGAHYKHGDDAAECTDALLTRFFSYRRLQQ